MFVRAADVASLDDAATLRRQCIDVLSWAKLQEPLYKSVEAIADAIDGLAEVVTGDRWTFNPRVATTLWEALPPVKWRTVE